jgi:MFS transporter, putative metabolite:H+ symporter
MEGKMNHGYAASRLDQMPLRGYVLKLVLIISLGAFFELYDLSLTAYIVPALIKQGIFTLKAPSVFSANSVSTFVAMLFAGMFIGAGFFGWLLDKYGRRPVFTCALVGYSACTLVMAFQTDPFWINTWRLLASIGIGLEQVAIVTYASELVASRYRGRAIAITQAVGFMGVPTVALVAWLLVPTTVYGLDGWRVVVIIGAIGAVFVWWIRQAIPESPIWLERRGDHERSRAALEKIEARVWGRTGRPPQMEATAAANLMGSVAPKGGWAALFAGDVRGRVLMMIVVNLCITIGYYGFASWVPSLLAAKGITTTKSLEYSFLIAFASPVAPILTLLIADKLERKFQVMLTCTACALLGIAFAMQSAPAVIVVIGFLLTLNNGWLSSSYHAYQAELFPAHIRGRAVGFCYSWSRLSAVFASYIIGWLLAEYGNIGVFTFITAAMATIVLTVMIFGPKTNKTVAA